jgi:hypothetical protein
MPNLDLQTFSSNLIRGQCKVYEHCEVEEGTNKLSMLLLGVHTL